MILDIVVLIFVSLGFYQGFSKGLVKTIFSVLALIIAVVASLKLSPIVIGFLQSVFNVDPAIMFILGFILTFVVVMMAIRFIGNKVDNMLHTLHIGGVNKLLGGTLLALIYAVLVSYGIYFMNRIELISEKQKEASVTYPIVKKLPPASQRAGETLKPVFNEFWNVLIETMEAIEQKATEDKKKGE